MYKLDGRFIFVIHKTSYKKVKVVSKQVKNEHHSK